MLFAETELPGAYFIDVEPREDERGFFARAWCREEFAKNGLEIEIAQCNLAYNHRAGTLRGMHFQSHPHAEVKLVRCTRGAVYDVVIDLRRESSTFMHWIGVELTEENRRMVYVPEGFAHGYQTLVDGTETFYQVSQPYVPEAGMGVRWDDPAFNIEWPPVDQRIISSKDQAWPDFTPAESLSP